MWLALFREDDLVRECFRVQGEDVPAFAPLCSKEKALAQFDRATPYLAETFADLGPIREYSAIFRPAIEQLPFQFLSIELEEIASLVPPEHRFEEILTLALRGFDRPGGITFHCDDVSVDFSGAQVSVEISADDGDEIDDELRAEMEELQGAFTEEAAGEPLTIPGFTATSHAQTLGYLGSLREGVGLPPARLYLDGLEYSDDEQWNFTRVLGAGRFGAGFGREVPWEKQDSDFGFTLVER